MTHAPDATLAMPPLRLRAVGFCGVDDSVHPHLLAMISAAFPLVEWGVLLRPDRQGQPRYASYAWLAHLSAVAATARMKLAAHLCGTHVNELLRGERGIVEQVQAWGFQRIQINATAVNGVDTSVLSDDASIRNVYSVILDFPDIEFILQNNEETQPLWQGLLDLCSHNLQSDTTTTTTTSPLSVPTNLSMLVDESKGTGVMASSWPAPPSDYKIGYAGGIGPATIRSVLTDLQRVTLGQEVWIDMESSLRSSMCRHVHNDSSDSQMEDVFDIQKCYAVIEAVCDAGCMTRPNFLPSS
jgi:hypothetical protein